MYVHVVLVLVLVVLLLLLFVVILYIWNSSSSCFYAAISSSSFPHLSKKTETGTENQDKLNRDLMISTSLGSISGGIIFFVSKTERKRPFLIADFVIIIGVIFSSFSNGELGLCFGRFFVGTGVSILTLSSPLLVSETWPTGTGLLASVGFWYQTGQVAGDLLSWVSVLVSNCSQNVSMFATYSHFTMSYFFFSFFLSSSHGGCLGLPC